jgi:hypothetical protein
MHLIQVTTSLKVVVDPQMVVLVEEIITEALLSPLALRIKTRKSR